METGCLCCDQMAEVGVLCRGCAIDVAPCEGLIADHLRSNVDPEEAAGWIVDGFGTAHALLARSTLGRHQDGQFVILSSSVSREHARLEKTSDGWHVRDLGSHNGTFVDDQRVQGRASLPHHVRIKIGDVALWFLAEVRYQPSEGLSMATVTAGGGMLRYVFTYNGIEMCLVVGSDPGVGGALLTRGPGQTSWVERGLAPLELQLLRALCVRAIEEANSPSTVRGCVATRQLVRDLPFQSKYANEENVRQVVRRVRGELGDVGADGLLAVAPGRGYYLTTTIAITK